MSATTEVSPPSDELSPYEVDYVVTKDGDGRPVVQLSVEDFEEMLEDLDDLRALLQAAKENSGERIPLEQVMAEMKADGLLDA